MEKIKIAGVGCCLLDYLYKGIDFNSPVFRKYITRSEGDGGFSPGKLVFTEDFEQYCGKKFMAVLTEMIGEREPDKYNLGGPAIVALIHAAQMLGEQADVSFYCSLGDDTTGETILSIISQSPVKLAKLIYSQKDSPYTFVLSDSNYNDGHGERTFVNNIGAAWDMNPQDLDDTFFSSDIIVFGGTAIVPDIHKQLPGLLKRGKENNCITIVNTVYDFISEKSNPADPWHLGDNQESYQYIDLLIMDNEEALRISGKTEIKDALNFYIESNVSALVITNGHYPIWLYSDGSLFRPTEPIQMPVSEKISLQVKDGSDTGGDTTGCGDNFAGGVIAALARQLMSRKAGELSLPIASAWGIVSGGFTCFYMGGTYLEEKTGEKYQLIKPFYEAYRKQITEEG